MSKSNVRWGKIEIKRFGSILYASISLVALPELILWLPFVANMCSNQ